MKSQITRILVILLAAMFCFGVNGTALGANNTGHEIVELVDFDTITRLRGVLVGDADGWSAIYDELTRALRTVIGRSADGYTAELTMETLDVGDVDITTPGDYTVTATLALKGGYATDFTLPDTLRTIELPIWVSEPAYFEARIAAVTEDAVYVIWNVEPESTPRILSFVNARVLRPVELPSVSWALSDERFARIEQGLVISSNELEQGWHYYFRLEAGSVRSDIIYLYREPDEGETQGRLIDQWLGGAEPFPEPSVTGTTAQTTGSGTDMDNETYSSDTVEQLTGAAFKRLLASGGGEAKIYKQGVMVTIPQSSLSVRDEDIVRVELSMPDRTIVSLSVMLNGVEVYGLPNVTVAAPYQRSGENMAVWVQDGGRSVRAEYDPILNMVIFPTDRTGEFTLFEKEIGSDDIAMQTTTTEYTTNSSSGYPSGETATTTTEETTKGFETSASGETTVSGLTGSGAATSGTQETTTRVSATLPSVTGTAAPMGTATTAMVMTTRKALNTTSDSVNAEPIYKTDVSGLNMGIVIAASAFLVVCAGVIVFIVYKKK
ncbi:MAG: hypothetical protein VB111_10160 [Clostridiaceae bacterium]|nr:hypothetical protein [Clostridiaceae bacterium]